MHALVYTDFNVVSGGYDFVNKVREGVNKVLDFVDKILPRCRFLSTKFFNVDRNVDGFIPRGIRDLRTSSTLNNIYKEINRNKKNGIGIGIYSLNLEIMRKIINQCCFVYGGKKLCGFTRREKGLP